MKGCRTNQAWQSWVQFTRKENYRGIALLSVIYKVLYISINRHLTAWAEEILGEYQCGFRQGWSTIDHIFSYRQILEKNIMSICIIYLWIKNKRTTVFRKIKALEYLRALGIPGKLVRLIGMTWHNTSYQIKINNSLSESFNVEASLRSSFECGFQPLSGASYTNN